MAKLSSFVLVCLFLSCATAPEPRPVVEEDLSPTYCAAATEAVCRRVARCGYGPYEGCPQALGGDCNTVKGITEAEAVKCITALQERPCADGPIVADCAGIGEES